MRRYLTQAEIHAALNLGKDVEQFLGSVDVEGGPAIRYLVLCRQKERVTVNVYERFLPADSKFLDVVEFEPVDPEEDSSDHEFEKFDDAIAFAVNECGAQTDRFVNQGMVQEELKDYLNSRR